MRFRVVSCINFGVVPWWYIHTHTLIVLGIMSLSRISFNVDLKTTLPFDRILLTTSSLDLVTLYSLLTRHLNTRTYSDTILESLIPTLLRTQIIEQWHLPRPRSRSTSRHYNISPRGQWLMHYVSILLSGMSSPLQVPVCPDGLDDQWVMGW